MNTEQSYRARPACATNLESEAQILTQPMSTPDGRIPTVITPSYARWKLNDLLEKGSLTSDQRDWSSIIPVMDDSMSPRMVAGGAVVIHLLDPTEYSETTGIVAITLNEKPNVYLFGRIVQINRQTLVLSRDNQKFSGQSIARVAIQEMYQVTHLIDMPLL